MDKSSQTACFTGHRVIRHKDVRLQENLRNILGGLIGLGYQYFEAGGARGFDMLASETVLELKKIYPHIRLVLILPFLDQFTRENWDSTEIERYVRLKNRADDVVHLQDVYSSGCYYRRNRRLVDDSSVCISYQYKNNGGTAYTTQYAAEMGLQIISCI